MMHRAVCKSILCFGYPPPEANRAVKSAAMAYELSHGCEMRQSHSAECTRSRGSCINASCVCSQTSIDLCKRIQISNSGPIPDGR